MMPSVGIGVANYERVRQRRNDWKEAKRTVKKGGAPFGKAGSATKSLTRGTEPPSNDQKLAG